MLPQPLLLEACRQLGAPAMDQAQLDACLNPLRRYIARAPAGQDSSATMLYGLFHQSLADYFTGSLDSGQGVYRVDRAAGHRALAAAIAALAPADQRTPANVREPLQDYAERAEPDHLWHGGALEQVLRSIDQRPSQVPAENLARWQRWHQEFATHFRPDHPAILATRHGIASWTAQAEGREKAVALWREMLPDFDRALGPDHPSTREVRRRLGEAERGEDFGPSPG